MGGGGGLFQLVFQVSSLVHLDGCRLLAILIEISKAFRTGAQKS